MTARPALVLACLVALASGVDAEARDATSCFTAYEQRDRTDGAYPEDIEEVERVWGAPLPADLLVIGGIDQFGWARVCRIADDRDGLFEGEYRDRQVWYRGRFVLRAGLENAKVPEGALETHYMSAFSHNVGLLHYPLGNPEPPVQYLVLEPVDPEGFAALPPIDNQ